MTKDSVDIKKAWNWAGIMKPLLMACIGALVSAFGVGVYFANYVNKQEVRFSTMESTFKTFMEVSEKDRKGIRDEIKDHRDVSSTENKDFAKQNNTSHEAIVKTQGEMVSTLNNIAVDMASVKTDLKWLKDKKDATKVADAH